MIPLAAIAAAAALLAATPPAPGKKDSPAPRDPDADVVANMELLERIEMLQHLDVLLPRPAPGGEATGDGAPAPEAAREPPPQSGENEKARPAPPAGDRPAR